ncbi:putative non-inhibitory serpin-Z5 [Raphanus sativus]|uniref:Serpin-Z2-like n=1 Tax=Raphanus sativus TaxID=3726 RepID=A0A6J0L623_RAPSA|nr:serpin-Z2-like [Raphanus sativus]KAJ4875213.1 putative non-inhibitory serpin-Z5 [Raphanus sativus]
MDPKEKRQKLSTPELESRSLSKKDVLAITNPSLNSKVDDVGEAMKKQNDVAMFLTEKAISALARNSNFVFSPASINAALTMLAVTTEEETLRSSIFSILKTSSIDELNAVFHEVANTVLVDGTENGGPKISAINGVWMEQSLSLSPSKKDLLQNFFKAALAQVDFRFKSKKVRKEVNEWASRHTNDLIKNILPHGSVTSDTDWIYGNAIYFKGAWKDKFPKSLTSEEEFYRPDGTSVSVPFMTTLYRSQYVREYDDFKVLKLLFQQGRDIDRQFSMYFYLPDDKDGLDSLVKRMASTPGFLDSHIPTEKVSIGEFRIPKFKIEFGFEALEAFNELGLDSVSLHHKAFVEVDEDGAEAAAVTVTGGRRGRRLFGTVRLIDFVADHPFLFLIKEDITSTIMFVGQVFDPPKPSSA